jgi:hypothetical protein
VDDAKTSSPARVAAELANPTTRQRLLSLARWIMKVNAPKEHSPSAAHAEDLVQTAVALAYDPKKKPWLPPKTFLTLHFLLVALVLIVAPNFALGFADTALEPYEHTGWAWRLLVSLPVAAVLVALGGAIPPGTTPAAPSSSGPWPSTRPTTTPTAASRSTSIRLFGSRVGIPNALAEPEVVRPPLPRFGGTCHRARLVLK